jgi:hypothetical protein
MKLVFLCNWCSSRTLTQQWKRFTPNCSGIWGTLETLELEDSAIPPLGWTPGITFIVINTCSILHSLNPKQVMVFHMEPFIPDRPEWWGRPFGDVYGHARVHNTVEWHLSYTYNQLKFMRFDTKHDRLSTIQSNKRFDPGHLLRHEMIQSLDAEVDLDVFGTIQGSFKSYKGPLPPYAKEDGLREYKYTFACENNKIHNYLTEKLVDGILCECLVFYWGCPNVFELLPEGCCVVLGEDVAENCKRIRGAMDEKLWEQRLPLIQAAKAKILDEMQVFPRLETLLTSSSLSL